MCCRDQNDRQLYWIEVLGTESFRGFVVAFRATGGFLRSGGSGVCTGIGRVSVNVTNFLLF